MANSELPPLPAGFTFAGCTPSGVRYVLPHRPWVVDPYTPVCVREDLLEQTILDGMQDPAVQAFAQQVWNTLPEGASPTRIAAAVLRAVQVALIFTPDPTGQEVFQPVVWTLRYRRGDCEDYAAVVATVDRLLGLEAVARWVNQPERALNHVGSFVTLDRRLTWQDASVFTARLGESPYDALAREGLQRFDLTG